MTSNMGYGSVTSHRRGFKHPATKPVITVSQYTTVASQMTGEA